MMKRLQKERLRSDYRLDYFQYFNLILTIKCLLTIKFTYNNEKIRLKAQ